MHPSKGEWWQRGQCCAKNIKLRNPASMQQGALNTYATVCLWQAIEDVFFAWSLFTLGLNVMHALLLYRLFIMQCVHFEPKYTK